MTRCCVKAFERVTVNPFNTSGVVIYRVPAADSVTRDYFTQASIQAVIWLQGAGTLTGRPIHGAVTGVTQTLPLVGPAVHHAAGKLVAAQELTGICLVS